MITDHKYDAGWPRDDSKGCIAVWTRDSGPTYMREAGDLCAAPENSHKTSEYPVRAPGDMHEPDGYPFPLDWLEDDEDQIG